MTTHLSRLAGPALLSASALLAAGGLALLAARALRSSAAVSPPAVSPLLAATVSPVAVATVSSTATPSAPAAAARVQATLVCSFSNADAAASQVQGADGGQSVVVGDRTYWLFGDTLFLPASGKQIEANSMAWSSGDAPGLCPKLQYYARNGIAVPFIPKDGSLTVWPAGAFPVDAHSFDVYTVYVYGSGPYAYWIGEVGLAHVDTATMRVTTLSRRLWGAASAATQSQVIGAQPVDTAGGYLRVVLQTQAGDHLLARVPLADVADPRAYDYWTGDAWSPRLADAVPMWPHAHSADPLARVVSYDAGGSIAYNAYLGKYVAVVNEGIGKMGARFADRIEGPWSAPVDWIDCSAIAQPAVPVCYSPYQHPQLATGGGHGIFLTFTRMAAYDVVAYRIELGAPGPAQGRAR